MPSKAVELRELPDDDLYVGSRREGRALQPALPAGDRAARQHGAAQGAAPRRRASGDGAPRAGDSSSTGSRRRKRARMWLRRTSVSDPTTTKDVANDRGRRKVRVGVVVSDGMDKTVVVRIDRQSPASVVRQRRFAGLRSSPRTMRRTTRTWATRSGSPETRPVSKTKRWRVVEVVERAK